MIIPGSKRSIMPRRKKTRKNQASRMRPMLPEGDLDTSMSIDERKAKLDVYLKDLNVQGKGYKSLYVRFPNLHSVICLKFVKEIISPFL